MTQPTQPVETPPPDHTADFHEALEWHTGQECQDCLPWSNTAE